MALSRDEVKIEEETVNDEIRRQYSYQGTHLVVGIADYEDEQGRESCMVTMYNLSTEVDERNNGQARKIMEYAILDLSFEDKPTEFLLKAGSLDETTSQEKLVKFYESFGFERAPQYNQNYGQGMLDLGMVLIKNPVH